MPAISKIAFIDISERERRALQQLKIDIDKLQARKVKLGGSLSPADEEELQRLLGLDASKVSPKFVDPLIVTTRAAFADTASDLKPLDVVITATGQLVVTAIGAAPPAGAAPAAPGTGAPAATPPPGGTATAAGGTGAVAAAPGTGAPAATPPPSGRGARGRGVSTDSTIARVSLVMGLLQLRGAPLPPPIATGTGIEPNEDHPNAPLFAEEFFRAVGRAAGNMDLALRVLGLIDDGLSLGGGTGSKVSSLEYAKVVEKLIAQGVQASDPNLKRHVEESLDRVQEIGDDDKPQHEIGIRLPDLEATTDHHVVEDNIRLIGPMIFASMFDELKAFQVVDRLIEMSQRGELALVKGKAGTQLYNYWRQAPNRMSETERQTFYAITLGLPTGPPGVTVNRDFPDLWIRFVSSVSSLVRESRVDQMIRSSLPFAINQQQVKKTARDLTSNMSLYGYGMAYYAAVDLQAQINEMIELLQDDELKRAFGARDMWGVIDQVAATELGGARNSSKYRMLATSGAIITTWLANNLDRLRDATRPMIDLRDVENAPARPKGQTAASHPTDYDLVNACEMWLADSAMDDERVEVLSQPRESPQQPSRPVQIPSFARDLLEGAGLGFEMSAGARQGARGNGRANGRAAYPGF